MEGATGARGEWIVERVVMTVTEFCTEKAVLGDRVNSPVIPPLRSLCPQPSAPIRRGHRHEESHVHLLG